MPTVDEALDTIETQVGLLRGQGVDPTRISGLEQAVYDAKQARAAEATNVPPAQPPALIDTVVAEAVADVVEEPAVPPVTPPTA